MKKRILALLLVVCMVVLLLPALALPAAAAVPGAGTARAAASPLPTGETATAQPHTTGAAPAAITDVTMPSATDYEAKLSGMTEGAGMNFYGATLLLQDKINIKLFLRTKDGADISEETLKNYRMKITKTDGTVVKELGKESIAYQTGSRDTVMVTATALPATYYGEMLCFTLTDGEGNAVSPTLHYGVMMYVARQYNEAGGDEKLNGILRAIVAYCNAVTAYHD